MTSPPYNPSMPPTAYPPGGRLSKSALTSLILGILGCIPIIAGALALLMGIIGFVKTGKPGIKGRWMAVVGSILGAISLIGWTIGLAAGGLGIVAAMGMTEAPRAAAHQFIRDLAAGNEAQAKANSIDFSDQDIKEFHEILSAKGDFVDSSFTSFNRNNNEFSAEGTATFTNGKKAVKVHLTQQDGVWKVDGLSVKEPE